MAKLKPEERSILQESPEAMYNLFYSFCKKYADKSGFINCIHCPVLVHCLLLKICLQQKVCLLPSDIYIPDNYKATYLEDDNHNYWKPWDELSKEVQDAIKSFWLKNYLCS